MTQPQSVITDAMRATIGKESEVITYEVDRSSCRAFARAVGYTDPVYYDAEAARAQGYRDIPAPFGFLGHPALMPGQRNPAFFSEFPYEPPLKRILNGGNQLQYFADVCAGDVLQASAHIAELTERQGGMGLMVMSVKEVVYRDQQGKTVAKLRGTIILY